MSFRELRNFTEMLRALGYPRHVSIENFRSPNFKLVAEILVWMLKRYDPDNDLPMVLDTEQDRVIFIKTAALFLVQKARIKVNPKKLYQADGYAVQELLKVSSVLYGAMRFNQYSGTDDTEQSLNVSAVASGIYAKMSELRVSRSLASEIPEKGASLYDLLSKEVELRDQRSTALARPLELKEVEKSLRASVRAVEDETRSTLSSLNNVASDEASLDARIEKKRGELERQQKRLAQLQSVRPAYMDEYEKLEGQLKGLYSHYVLKFRNLSFLDQMQNEYDRAEHDRKAEAEMSLRKMAEKMREEERAKQLEEGRLDQAADLGDPDFSGDDVKQGPKVYGNITGAGLSDEDEDEEEDYEEHSPLSEDDEDEIVGQPRGGKGQRTAVADEDKGLSDFSAGEDPIKGNNPQSKLDDDGFSEDDF